MVKPVAVMSWTNHVDAAAAVLSASSQAGDLSPSNMVNSIIGRRWRTTVLTAYAEIDFGADVQIGVLALRFPRDVALPLTASVTHALDADGGTSGAGVAYSSGVVSLGLSDGYGYHVHIPAAVATARYWRFTFSSVSGVSYIDVGRAWAGPKWSPTHNMVFGYNDEWMDLSRVSASERSGAEFVDERARQRGFAFSFEALSEAERDQVREMQRLIGVSRQVLLVKDSAAWTTETLIGRLAESSPIRHTDMPIYSKAFTIRESL